MHISLDSYSKIELSHPFQKLCFYEHVSSLLKVLMKYVSDMPLHSNIERGKHIRDTGIFEHCIISIALVKVQISKILNF